ncbi:unnamed protein product [Thlaspi arvense]|uniref:Large ribosomal subunit protein bL12 C-terminal domain-containing protein n=1 Tax=Thlaspi arvense TaxID=13288 RepID=A0AAU9S5F0_THLAR|nr:unnamed protein product [Thlaspi arvense]
MQAFRNAGGRRLFATVGGNGRRFPPRRVLPKIVPGDSFGRPRPLPRLMALIKQMQGLSHKNKLKYGFIFSEILGLPKPPELPRGADENFAVKLVKFDPDKRMAVLRAVAWVKSLDSIKVVKHLSEMGLSPTLDAVENVPSVIKEGVSEEEANQIIAKIQAAGGVAVMEPME